MSNTPLLEVEKLQIKNGNQALVQDLSYSLNAGETLGLVGESGSGKTLSTLALMGLLAPNLKVQGQLKFKGRDLSSYQSSDWTKIRGKEIAMVFQEPMSALNPSMKCGMQVAEMLQNHGQKEGVKASVLELFEKVELPRITEIYNSYPHQLSGGQKQRVVIAMAIANNPSLLIADEPTTALDVSVQASILKLLSKLQSEFGMALIFISHDLGVVRDIADRVMVMYHGELKESGPTKEVFEQAKDPYTKGLLACRPNPDTHYKRLPLVQDFILGHVQDLEQVSPRQKEKQAQMKTKQSPILKIKGLAKVYRSKSGIFGKAKELKAVDDVSFQIFKGESLGLVGESGSGKSTIGRILVGLEKLNAGSLEFEDQLLSDLKNSDWRKLNRSIQIIFQDPFGSLNPRLTAGESIAEVLRENGHLSKADARERALELLEKVGLLRDYAARYPHEFSGGQRQRIGIARALAMSPKVLVCDESVSALDVSVQAQILNLLNDLKEEFDFTYLFISHDLQVVRYFCDRVIVLKDGKLVEEGYAESLFRNPQQDYTANLIANQH
ncbi:MAG: ABC transporter ATP-binding protein [Bacteroidetes bacterium]|nr:ABC transporter ATP-binding protein [Bacteroidota bacterium]